MRKCPKCNATCTDEEEDCISCGWHVGKTYVASGYESSFAPIRFSGFLKGLGYAVILLGLFGGMALAKQYPMMIPNPDLVSDSDLSLTTIESLNRGVPLLISSFNTLLMVIVSISGLLQGLIFIALGELLNRLPKK